MQAVVSSHMVEAAGRRGGVRTLSALDSFAAAAESAAVIAAGEAVQGLSVLRMLASEQADGEVCEATAAVVCKRIGTALAALL